MTRRPSTLGAAALLVLTAAAGCGGGDDDPYAVPDRFEEYCEEVAAQQAEIGRALESGGEATGLIKALPSFEALAEKAPDDIADDWDVVIERIDGLVEALEDAGIDPEAYDRKNPPTGLDPEQKEAIDVAAVALVSATTAQAMSSVQQQARDVCKTPLLM